MHKINQNYVFIFNILHFIFNLCIYFKKCSIIFNWFYAFMHEFMHQVMHRCTVGAVLSKIWHRRCGVNFLVFWHRTAGHSSRVRRGTMLNPLIHLPDNSTLCSKVDLMSWTSSSPIKWRYSSFKLESGFPWSLIFSQPFSTLGFSIPFIFEIRLGLLEM